MARFPVRPVQERVLAGILRVNPGALPDFLIVGAQKAGTSSLFAALCSHPSIRSSLRKEVHYFDLRRDSHALSWYRGHFPPRGLRGPDTLTGEASPSYMFFPDCAEAIAAVCPRARILIVLRDPVRRALSHYRHNRRLHPALETEVDAERALFAETERVGAILARLADATAAERARAARFAYLTRGHYAEQIARFHAAFDPAQIMVLDTGDLAGAPSNGLADRLCAFLGVPSHPLVFERYNTGGGDTAVDPNLVARLTQYYAPHDATLTRLMGRSMYWQDAA